jgi:uncharacterized protein YfiM (DUF2279 family)
VLWFSFKPTYLKGQDSLSFFEDDIVFNKKRTLLSSSVLGVGTVGSISALSLIWYNNVPKTSFQFFNDGKEWLQMDKVGHVYSGWLLSKTAADLFSWGGIVKRKSALLGSAFGFSYLLAFEVLDGFALDWGFSWHDIASNSIGAGLFLGQSFLWGEQRVKLKFSAHLTSYAQYRPNVLGSTFPERILKDYNGQTYWLSASPGKFIKNEKFPDWLCFSIGYGADGMIYGQDSQPYIPIIGGEALQFNRYRTLALSLDIDLSEIPINKPWVKRFLGVLNTIKVPFPAVIIGGGEFKGSWLYF